jgi:major membrane immunogen (membrane-anchored lipoprotein)
MKPVICSVCLLFLVACSESDVKRITFQKTLEYKLKNQCGDDQKCVTAVDTQTEKCINKSNAENMLKNQEDKEEFKRFTTEFYACLVDEKGKPLFHVKLD